MNIDIALSVDRALVTAWVVHKALGCSWRTFVSAVCIRMFASIGSRVSAATMAAHIMYEIQAKRRV